ncbi:HAD family phosphatase [Emcibacter sp.]|uniref:HAD family hydrolase n=1 Tax=Emcibacter sp. TaxID=1979954 RepID=UPI002AA7F597|nr:HAD family phosphatase [Emcibacter sp.]
MNERKPGCIVFDLGNVLVRWHPRNAYAPLFNNDDRDLDHFLENICNMDWHNRLDAGESFADAIDALSARHPEHADMIRAYDSHWDHMFAGAIEENVDILNRLHRAGHPLFALTNFPTEKYDSFCNSFDFMSLFRDVIVSGQEGVIKPKPEIYHILKDRTGFAAEDTLFIDDRADNIAAAEKIGFRTHHFTTPGVFEQNLRGLGLLP